MAREGTDQVHTACQILTIKTLLSFCGINMSISPVGHARGSKSVSVVTMQQLKKLLNFHYTSTFEPKLLNNQQTWVKFTINETEMTSIIPV